MGEELRTVWEENLAALREALQLVVDRSIRTRGELSERIGRHPTYVSRLLRGETRLRVEEVFHLLSELDELPEHLLFRTFPLGGPAEARILRTHPAVQDPGLYPPMGGTATRDLLSAARWETGTENPSSVALAITAGRLLARLIRRRGTTQTRVGPAIGMSARALGKALNGETDLTFEVVFRVLEEIDIAPGRFAVELFTPPDGDVVDRMEWLRLLDEAEGRRRRMAEGLDVRRRELQEEEERRARREERERKGGNGPSGA